mmetsp:Transcript_81219/g.94688  ORF Transcript_81219/g.94688 Transcript_81219/m.94688 type:complete len:468 (-) Transcript_81219:20-1423(-)
MPRFPKNVFCAFVVALLIASVAYSSNLEDHDFNQVHRLPSHRTRPDAVEARVAELQLTVPWFLNNSRVTRATHQTPCPIPPTTGDVLFGLGYEAVADTMRTATCWITHQHRMTGNVDVDYMSRQKASLVHGAGVSELLIASIMTLAGQFAPELGKPIVSTTLAPYYAVLKQVCLSSVLRGVADWVEPGEIYATAASPLNASYPNTLRGRPLILIAIVPSNPTGSMQSGLLSHCEPARHSSDARLLDCFGGAFQARVVSDHSYFWPCLVAPSLRNGHGTSVTPDQEEWQWKWPIRPIRSSALLFGLSKLSGHSGVRHGWAWVMDQDTARLMRQHLWELGTSLSASAMSQSALVLATISLGTQPTFHEWCEHAMVDRYRQLHRHLPAGYVVKSVEQSATALIACPVIHRARDVGGSVTLPCAEIMHDVGILATSGVAFGATEDTARVSMGVSEDAFSLLLQRFMLLPTS